MDAQQEIFSYFRAELEALKNSPEKVQGIYDGALPGMSAEYPFIYLGEAYQTGTARVKHALFDTCTVSLDIHIWVGSVKERGRLSRIMQNVRKLARSLGHTQSYKLMYAGDSERVIADTSTATALLHGVVSVSYECFERSR